jgi:phenylalanyl-tRNA synthetase alpha chain
MLESIEQTKHQFLSALSACDTLERLEQVRIGYLARSGKIAALFESLKNVPVADKPLLGKSLNELRAFAQAQFDSKKTELTQATSSNEDRIDLTLPGRPRPAGSKHPVMQTMEEMKRIFVNMGFSIASGPEIESDYYNFGALNFPPDHPARDMQDTFYISENVVLRTHTSPMQVRVMESQKPPVSVIAPGKVYRRDSDVSHTPMFHQVEGLLVDRNVTFGQLKGTLTAFVKEMFGKGRGLRFRPSFFPFTEPSAEVDIACVICGGKGCRTCGQTGWLEILGSGMVDPEVYGFVDYDPEEYSGFAFGMGMERIAMLKYGIDDIQLFFKNDMRFLRQF